ncbi:hypothetical protein Nmel_005607, partial [Mimus melanotis]
YSLPWGRGGAASSPQLPPAPPHRPCPAARRPRRAHTHSPDSPPGTAWRRPGPRPGAAREQALVPSNMAPPPTTPAPRLSENKIGGGRRSPRQRRDWLLAPLTHTATRALPRCLTGIVVCAGRAGGRLRVPPGIVIPAGQRSEAVPAILGAFPPRRGREILLREQLSVLRSVPGVTGAPQVRRTERENLQLLDQSRGFCLSLVVLNARSRQ